jgi:hypothetical protein
MLVVLDDFNLYGQLFNVMHGGFNCLFLRTMFEQIEREVINEIALSQDVVKYSKVSLNKLKKIKELKTGKKENECFCSNVRRRVWFKDFIQWFESNS